MKTGRDDFLSENGDLIIECILRHSPIAIGVA